THEFVRQAMQSAKARLQAARYDYVVLLNTALHSMVVIEMDGMRQHAKLSLQSIPRGNTAFEVRFERIDEGVIADLLLEGGSKDALVSRSNLFELTNPAPPVEFAREADEAAAMDVPCNSLLSQWHAACQKRLQTDIEVRVADLREIMRPRTVSRHLDGLAIPL